jgi:hypothetical protein
MYIFTWKRTDINIKNDNYKTSIEFQNQKEWCSTFPDLYDLPKVILKIFLYRQICQ